MQVFAGTVSLLYVMERWVLTYALDVTDWLSLPLRSKLELLSPHKELTHLTHGHIATGETLLPARAFWNIKY